jgi:hypothetical protein
MTISKREFLVGATAAGGGMLLGRFNAAAQAGRRVVDAHTHWYPAEWVELVQNEGEAAGARLGRNASGGITFNAAGINAVFSPHYIDLESRSSHRQSARRPSISSASTTIASSRARRSSWI